VDQLEW